MVYINYLKIASCFDIDEYNAEPKKEIEFRKDDGLDRCRETLCQYYSFSRDILKTIRNKPLLLDDSFRFTVKTVKNKESAGSIQILSINGQWKEDQEPNFSISSGEWRRYLICGSAQDCRGERVNIDGIIEYAENSKDCQKSLVEKWDLVMALKINFKDRGRVKHKVTADEIIKQIKTGTAKMYRNIIES